MDFITACIMWLTILVIIATIVGLLGIAYVVCAVPFWIYHLVVDKLRRS